MKLARRAAVLLAAVGAAATPALAEGGGLPLKLDYKSVLTAGKDRPCLRLTATGELQDLQVSLSRAGKRHQFEAERLVTGASRSFCWTEQPGLYEYNLDIACRFQGTRHHRSMHIKLSYLPPLAMRLTRAGIDVQAHRLVFTLNHPADHAELTIQGRRGRVIGTAEQAYAGAAPGAPLALTWKPVAGEVTRMGIKAYDTDGGWVSMAVVPWMISIPHEEVVFETDQADVRPDEAPKLDAAIKLVHKALAEHPADFQVNLYVAGFTDTQGSRAHNRALSTARARAIAAYFRARGVHIPIYSRGYGQEVLAVRTPDNTDEPRNRRALYVLGTQPPVIAKEIAWGTWSPVR